MSWLVTMLIGGVLLSIGWRLGNALYDYVKGIIEEYPEGIRKIRRYQKQRNLRYTEAKRRRRLESR